MSTIREDGSMKFFRDREERIVKKIIRKILPTLGMLALVLVTVLSVSVEARAANINIDSIELTVPSAPTEGMTTDAFLASIQINTEHVGRNGPYDGYCYFSDSNQHFRYVEDLTTGTIMGQNDTFVSGHKYMINFQVSMDYGYEFQFTGDRYSGNVMMNGMSGYIMDNRQAPNGFSMDIRIIYQLTSSGAGPTPGTDPAPTSVPVIKEHTHNWEYTIFSSPSINHDGEEGEVCTICGEVRNTQPLSAFAYALYGYALPMINSANPGLTVTLDFGIWNSFPKGLMEKIAAKSSQNVTFVFKYEYNHEKYVVTIPARTEVDLNHEWYGPAKMVDLYGRD